jgi:hypothetical protein
MIKKILVPVIDKELIIHVGASEWGKFVKALEKQNAKVSGDEKEAPPKGGGRAYGSWIYVDNLEDTNLVIHEVLHFLSDVYTNLQCESEEEFKAYIGAYVLTDIFKWLHKNKNKE